MISFTKPAVSRNEARYLGDVSTLGKTWGGGEFSGMASQWLQSHFERENVLLTQSCTSALELAALALGLGPGDEVIVPSYTFVSSASAFALRGAKIVFVDVEESSLNIDPLSVQENITENTRAIVAVHYGGQSANMHMLSELARPKGIYLVEDAAQAIGAYQSDEPVGRIGDFACFSFHGTKNLSSGEGGALVINTMDDVLVQRALLAHEKGTDRRSFLKGEVDKYTWRTLGSSFVPSEFTAAVMSAQLEDLGEITGRRLRYWSEYDQFLRGKQDAGFSILEQSALGNNGHMFAVLLEGHVDRGAIIEGLKSRGVQATSHYEALHTSPYVLANSENKAAKLSVTESASASILRLPMWSAEGLDTEAVAEALLSELSSAKS